MEKIKRKKMQKIKIILSIIYQLTRFNKIYSLKKFRLLQLQNSKLRQNML
jgi:hypothetical protein